MNTINDEARQYIEESLPIDTSEESCRTTKRAFYAGAQAVLVLLRKGSTVEQIQTDLIFFGRQVGASSELTT